uniref:Transmembrane BAX inhibitor motif containing 1 n=1 Tax=Lepisosteus oculatus TaxID=7918 RepID=W5LXT7_LEPOC
MSKPDIPPSYEESRNPLYPPQAGEYPQPPAYGPMPPIIPPMMPSSAMNPEVYPGDTVFSPAQTEAGWCTCFYNPDPLPKRLKRFKRVQEIRDPEGFTSADWDDKTVRHAFIRKVYLILAAQLLVTVAFVAVFTFCIPVRQFVVNNSALYWVSYAVFMVTYLVLACCKGPRRRFPWNIILLVVFTLALSYMTGTISSYYNTKAVFLALGITAIVCIIVTVFCFQTKVDFTSCGGLFCVLGIVVFVTGIITTIVLSYKYIPWLHMLYAAIGAIAYTLFLAYHTQLLIGNRKHSISPEEYVFGALSLYIDIVQIFLFLLQLIGSSR